MRNFNAITQANDQRGGFRRPTVGVPGEAVPSDHVHGIDSGLRDPLERA